MKFIEQLESSTTKSDLPELDIVARNSFDQMKLCFMVGVLAVALPITLAIIGFSTGQFHRTISHFYYTDQYAEEIFVGTLIGLGLIMLAYEGFSSNETEANTEARWASVGGFFAIGVAFLPTDGWVVSRSDFSKGYRYDYYDAVSKEPIDLLVGWMHLLSALCLFLVLAYFCLKIFTREHYKDHSDQENKKKRNFRYKISGYVILGCLAILALVHVPRINDALPWWNDFRVTFVLEALALSAFGYSWLVKSRFYGTSLLDPAQERAKAAAEPPSV